MESKNKKRQATRNKIVVLEDAKKIVAQWKNEGLAIVFTNGCFDLVHLGHIDYLEKARNLGDRLILGINTDASIKQIKGKQRPIVDENSRARLMAALAFVDLVLLFEDDTPLKLIKTLTPNVLVKGNDYKIDNIVGAEHVIATGGEVKTVDLVKGYSTSSIIEKIQRG